MALLDVANLTIEFGPLDSPFRAVDGLSFAIEPGEVVGIVGESGSGKSVSALAIMGLLDFPGRAHAERLAFGGRDLLKIGAEDRRAINGREVAMIFQEPMTSLNPCYTVGFQIAETITTHQGLNRRQARARGIELLTQVGIPDAASRFDSFPHQLSGGMNQRAMIAMAIACNPKLLIADEPTTALDVTIQAQILDLLLRLQRERGMALILITHDLGVVAEVAQRVIVMYAGQAVETSAADALFAAPRHPYTAALLNALPERSVGVRRLQSLPGVVPGAFDRPAGCLLNPRCPHAIELCRRTMPPLRPVREGLARCHTPLDGAGKPMP